MKNDIKKRTSLNERDSNQRQYNTIDIKKLEKLIESTVIDLLELHRAGCQMNYAAKQNIETLYEQADYTFANLLDRCQQRMNCLGVIETEEN